MSAVFADTSFYLALLRDDDPAHGRALGESRVRRPIVTMEFILLELGNACARAEDHADFLALVEGMRASPRVKIIGLDSRWLNRGLDLLAERPDKNWSLTDCISFVVMTQEGIHDALTADQHFEQAGFWGVAEVVRASSAATYGKCAGWLCRTTEFAMTWIVVCNFSLPLRGR